MFANHTSRHYDFVVIVIHKLFGHTKYNKDISMNISLKERDDNFA